MRVLHVVKTSEGALWAALQAGELVRRGVEVHVALPSLTGAAVPLWEGAGCHVHAADLSLPLAEPWRFPAARRAVQRLVSEVRPDLIQSHFVSTTLLLRLALGRSHPLPRLFQVPGPLHLEHALHRRSEIGAAGPGDFWIASSRCILNRYREAGIAAARVFLSYYGTDVSRAAFRPDGSLRKLLKIGDRSLVVGNISYMYRPRYSLGQFRGVKDHETLIDALGIVIRSNPRVTGVLIGGPWGNARGYAESLRRKAAKAGQGRILMPGAWERSLVARVWPDFDCAVHVPLSENCGGVVEPLLAGVPTVAAQTGGLPEVVIDGVTGKTAPAGNPGAVANTVLEVLDDLESHRRMATMGRALVQEMFDVQRTAGEVLQIYRHILDPSQPRPAEFDSSVFAREALCVPGSA